MRAAQKPRSAPHSSGELPGVDTKKRRASKAEERAALILARVRGEITDAELAERMAKL